MELRLTLQPRLETGLELEEGDYARTTRSPYIDGFPIEIYKRFAPVKIVNVDPRSLVYTDPLCFDYQFAELSKAWEDSILNAFGKRTWKHPLIQLPVIDGDGNIADGNHRCGAAGLHTRNMNAIIIENDSDIEAVRQLERTKYKNRGLFWWPHGRISYDSLMNKRDRLAREMSWEDYMSPIGGEHLDEAVYFGKNVSVERLIKYLISRVFHNYTEAMSGEYPNHVDFDFPPLDTHIPFSPIKHDKSFDQADLDDLDCDDNWDYLKRGLHWWDSDSPLLRTIYKIVQENPLLSRNRVYSIEDVVQDAYLLYRRSNPDHIDFVVDNWSSDIHYRKLLDYARPNT